MKASAVPWIFAFGIYTSVVTLRGLVASILTLSLASSVNVETTKTASVDVDAGGSPEPSNDLVDRKDHNPIDRVHDFLHLFGWRKEDPRIKDIPTAIRKVQRILHKPETGIYDEAIDTIMSQPRCGTTLISSNASSLDKRYVLWGPRRDHTSITYRFVNYTSDTTPSIQQAVVRAAFDHWSQILPLNFTFVPTGSPSDIFFQFVHMGTNETTYAATSILASGTGLLSGLIGTSFNNNYDWSDLAVFNFTALHEIGHAIGMQHSKVSAAVMWPFYTDPKPLHPDDEAGVHSMYGWRSPKWTRIDANPLTSYAVSTSLGWNVSSALDGLYQIRNDGTILKYAASGNWIVVENNPDTLQITGAGGYLYQRHTDGRIYRYGGSAWQLIGDASAVTAVQDIIAASDQIYQRRTDGWIARWTGSGTQWTSIGGQPAIGKQIAVTDTKTVYNLLNNGTVLRLPWPYGSGWQIIDQSIAVVGIAAGGDEFYKLHDSGQIYWLDWNNKVWTLIDDSGSDTIYAFGTYLYASHQDGGIYRYTGTPGVWEQLDKSSSPAYVIGDNKGGVWELLKSGEILRLMS